MPHNALFRRAMLQMSKGAAIAAPLALTPQAPVRPKPEVLDGMLILGRVPGGDIANVKIEIECSADGSAELRVLRWMDPAATFADERVVPLSRETYAAIERALFEPIDDAGYVATGTHVSCTDCDGEPGHHCMRCCQTGIVGSA